MNKKTNKWKCLAVIFTGALMGSAPLQAEWSWTMFEYQNIVYMNAMDNGLLRYTYRLGSGGCIRNIYDVQDEYKDLLSGSFNGETTDRVVQKVFWIHSVLSEEPNLSAGNQRWNVNQAGAVGADLHGNIFSPTVDVEINDTVKTVTVYTAQDDQFQSLNQDIFAASSPIAQCTIYKGTTDGVLSVRTVTRCPEVRKNGAIQQNYQTYLESWTAFKNNATNGFSGLCLTGDSSGNPQWYYTTDWATGNAPSYPAFTNEEHKGYAYLYSLGEHNSKTVLGMAFGVKNAVSRSSSGSTITNVLNTLTWPDPGAGIGILPGIDISNTVEGSFIDNEFKILLRPNANTEFMTTLENSSSSVLATTLYGPTHSITGDLKTITDNLDKVISQNIQGVRTESIALINGL